MTNPIPVRLVLPPRTECYQIKGALRLADGSWLFAAMIVDRGDPLKQREGVYIFRRPAPTLADPRPSEARPTTSTPITKLHGVLAVGQGGAVHYVCHDLDEVFFIPVAPVGSVEAGG